MVMASMREVERRRGSFSTKDRTDEFFHALETMRAPDVSNLAPLHVRKGSPRKIVPVDPAAFIEGTTFMACAYQLHQDLRQLHNQCRLLSQGISCHALTTA
jgi:hypothetical protein